MKIISQKMAQIIIDTIGQKMSSISLVALLHSLVLSQLQNEAIFL